MKKSFFVALSLFCFSFIFWSNYSFAHRSGCHHWHNCPPDRDNYVCGDLGKCSQCPDNQHCEGGIPRIEQAVMVPEKEKPTPKVSLNPANESIQSFSKPSRSTDFSGSKKKLLKMYLNAGMDKTLYCGCSFDSKKNIDNSTCGYEPRKATNKRSRKLEWERVMPAFKFGKVLQCWREPICKRSNGRPFSGQKCCSKVSPEFKAMAADMHNLFPAIGEVNEDRSNYPFGEIRGERRRYGSCDMEIKRKVAEPAEGIRGDIARVYFYMSFQYGVPLLKRFEDMLRAWHLSDPPDQWEMDRNILIEKIQGNRNPFIDHPEMVGQVKDF